MTYEQFFLSAKEAEIPLADIKVVMDACLPYGFDALGIHGKEEIPFNPSYLLQKLKDGYPANYLSGYIDIQKLHLFLNESTLIPRNETIQFVVEYLLKKNFSGKKILDLCTGSGVIALLLKKRVNDAFITGSDISQEALSMAEKSAFYNNLDVSFIKSDFLDSISDKFDIIISNPPYIPEDKEDVNAPFEPEVALYTKESGLYSYRRIFEKIKDHLTPDGSCYFELESTMAEKVKNLFLSFYPDEFSVSIWQDDYQRDRYLVCERKIS